MTGDPCGKWAIRGLTVCKMHGGHAPQARRAAAEYLIRQKALRLIPAPQDRAQITDVVGTLFELAEEMQAMKDVLAVIVNETAGTAGKGLGYRGGMVFDDDTGRLMGTGTEQTRAEFMAYERAVERLAKQLIDIARLDLDTRRLRVEEWHREQIQQMAGMLLAAVLRRAGLDYGDEQVRTWVVEEMAGLPGVVDGT